MKPAACREPSASGRKRAFFATLDVNTEDVLGQRFQSELVAVRRLLNKAIQRAEPAKKRKASPPPVIRRAEAPKKMTAGERELLAADLAELDVTKIAEEDEEIIDIVGGVSPVSIAPAPLQLAVEEDEYVDVCGDAASPVLMPMPKNPGQEDVISSSCSDSGSSGSDSGSESSSSDSDSDSSSSDSDSESGESVSSPAPAERAADDKDVDVDVGQPPAPASALAVPDDPLDDGIFGIDGAWFKDFSGGSMDMSTRAGVDSLEMELDAESSVHLAAAAGRKQAVTAMNLSPSLSSSESEDDAADEHRLPSSGSSKNSSGGTKRRLPQQQQQQSAPSGQRKLQQTESAVVVESGGGSNKGGYWCRHCGKAETPQWRAGPEGPNTLCNACGLRYKNTLAMATTTKRLPPGANRRCGAKCKNGRSISVMPSTAVKKKR